jgi:tripartite ATP-independent transporter DctM subunit
MLVSLMFALVIIGLLSGLWTAMALGGAGLVTLAITRGELGLKALAPLVWNSVNSFVLIAIPLFLLMGEIILRSGAGGKFYLGVSALMGRVRGPLLHANTISCAIFSAVSGSSVATAVTIGTMAIPEGLKQGYQPRLLFGSLAAGGTLGILIPPSLSMVMYGALVQESVSKLFIAGILPGIVLASIYLFYGFVRIYFDPSLAPPAPHGVPWRVRLAQSLQVVPMLLILVLVLGGIYSGFVTPTEAAALGCVAALVVAAGYKTLSWSMLRESLSVTVNTTCMLVLIIVGAQILATSLTYSGATREVTSWIVQLGLSKWEFFGALVMLYIVLGTVVDGVSMIYLTLPILFPSIIGMGFDAIWFGVVLTVLIELGQIHPPIGLNLFAIHSISQGHSFSDVAIGAAPYVGLTFMMVIILAIWPGLATWLPSIL